MPANSSRLGALPGARSETGDLAAGERAIEPIRRFGPPEVELFGLMPYIALQSMLDTGAPPGIRAHWKSGYVRHLGESQIEMIVPMQPRRPLL
jgi:hypothetical protein